MSDIQRRYVPIVLAVVIGGILIIAAFRIIRSLESENVMANFKLDAQDRINAIKREVTFNIEALENLYSFYEGSETVTREEFHKFVSPLLLRYPSIRALVWAPMVRFSEKNSFEKAAQDRFPGFRITEQNEQGMLMRAGRREAYFPLYYVEPFSGTESVRGFDLFSEPRRREALLKARDSGFMIATERITLVDEQEGQFSFLVFMPIYRKGAPAETLRERRDNLAGVLLGVFRIGDMVESALSYMEASGINIYLSDVTHRDREVPLYHHTTRAGNQRNSKDLRELDDRDSYVFQNTLTIADRTWKAVAVPVRFYIRDMEDMHPWLVSAGLTLLLLTVVLYLKKIADQAAYSEKMIGKLSNEIMIRKEVETALKSSEEEFRSLFENMNEGFAYHKMVYAENSRPVDYEFIMVNAAFEKATGLQRTAVPGKRVTELIPGVRESEPDLIALYGEVALTGKENAFEFYFKPFDKWYFVKVFSPRKDHFVTVFEDITDRKKFEIIREQLVAELSSKNSELEQILYVTSHDLRSPLVNVEGFSRELRYSLEELTKALRGVRLPADVEETISRILKNEVPTSTAYISNSISKMDAMLKGLLKLSRLGRYEFRSQEINMNEMIAEVIGNFKFTLKERRIAVHVSDLPPCRGDSGQINQVFSNLVDNALKFLHPGHAGEITVSGRKDGECSVYCVEDNGVGIEAVHQEKIFQLFQQLDPEEGRGEGLGLTIAHRIVERHHGKIWIESEPGKGSRFYVKLPG